MKREDLKKLLGETATDEVIDKIMGLHGADIETHKTKLTEAETTRDQFKTQLDEANGQIANFKGMKIEEIQQAAANWETKYNEATTKAATDLAKVKFDHALDSSLTSAKAKNAKAVKALLSTDTLKLNEDGTIAGLDDQLTKIKTENGYLFTDETKPPVIIKGGNNQPVIGDKVVDAARKAAGLTVTEGK